MEFQFRVWISIRMWNSALFSLPEHASIWRMYFRTEETEMIKLNKLDIIPCISGT